MCFLVWFEVGGAALEKVMSLKCTNQALTRFETDDCRHMAQPGCNVHQLKYYHTISARVLEGGKNGGKTHQLISF